MPGLLGSSVQVLEPATAVASPCGETEVTFLEIKTVQLLAAAGAIGTIPTPDGP